MHSMAFEPQPSAAPLKRDTPPLLPARPSQLWIRDGSESEWSDSSESSYNSSPGASYDEEDIFVDESSSSSACRSWKKTLLTLSFTVVLLAVSYFAGRECARRPLELKLHEAEELRSSLHESQMRLLTEKAELSRLPKINEILSDTIEQIKKDLAEKNRALKEEERRRTLRDNEIVQIFGQLQLNGSDEQSERQRREDLVKFIKTLAYDRYGTGTQEVEFHVRIWENGRSSEDIFVVEVAGFQLMPVSSYMFLQQVEHGLWDGTSFDINAKHVLLADTISGTKDRNRLPEMEAMGLGRLPVQEYNAEMPHVKYTLCYGSMAEAGSYFYVNKLDNTRTHKGQACFGRIVRGFDVIDRITSLETNSVSFKIQPVDIVSARLLKTAKDAKEVH